LAWATIKREIVNPQWWIGNKIHRNRTCFVSLKGKYQIEVQRDMGMFAHEKRNGTLKVMKRIADESASQ
jgi:hypothetical protein